MVEYQVVFKGDGRISGGTWKGSGRIPGGASLVKVKQFWACQCLSSVNTSSNNQHLWVVRKWRDHLIGKTTIFGQILNIIVLELMIYWTPIMTLLPESLLQNKSHTHGAISQRSVVATLWFGWVWFEVVLKELLLKSHLVTTFMGSISRPEYSVTRDGVV